MKIESFLMTDWICETKEKRKSEFCFVLFLSLSINEITTEKESIGDIGSWCV